MEECTVNKDSLLALSFLLPNRISLNLKIMHFLNSPTYPLSFFLVILWYSSPTYTIRINVRLLVQLLKCIPSNLVTAFPQVV